MIDYINHIAAHEERLKNLQREADNERLAREVISNEQGLIRNTRNMIGRGLVNVGQKLLEEKQR